MLRAAIYASALIAAIALTAGAADAQTSRLAVGVQGGTLGAGAGVQFSLNDYLVLRGSYDALSIERDDTYDDIAYNGDADFSSPGAFVDLHPFRNALLISGGVYLGDRSVSIDSTPTGSTEVGGVTFTPEQIGTLKGSIDLEGTAPFVGVGFDNTFTSGGHWGWRVLVGAAFSDEPQVDLASEGGTVSATPQFQAALAVEEAEIQAEADDYNVLPVVQVGLNYRF
ncbi:hypothetical protein ASG17_04805 [Brevundimonas sp. Leaf363]|uniref:hypothetical protein n=1 Tax=Brevundimonas sp. Leaf363 TaxID=1736353 RepID=UPI0006FE0638|nr:hypothetical protein [Brevundimonas sp. Leaf363]KQS55408.1 hypothetical protein ASG17_04805 [Brevundimonas sp. Leaf363]